MIPAVAEKLGDVNILVNNAGIIRRASARDYTEDDWDATLEIDLSAAFVLSQAAGRIMLKNGRGKIINVASVIAFQGGLNVAAYSVAKHGIAGLTKALANDWAKHGINVNASPPAFSLPNSPNHFRKTRCGPGHYGPYTCRPLGGT